MLEWGKGCKSIVNGFQTHIGDTDMYLCTVCMLIIQTVKGSVAYWLNLYWTERLVNRIYHLNDKEHLMNPVSVTPKDKFEDFR